MTPPEYLRKTNSNLILSYTNLVKVRQIAFSSGNTAQDYRFVMLKMSTDNVIPARPDRRKYLRQNAGTLKLCIRRKGLLRSFTKGEPVEWLNFNVHGLAFSCHSHFEINETVLLDIKTPSTTLHDIVAVIHNARKQAGKFRYGVQFYFGANSYMRSAEVRAHLLQIENELE